MCVNKLFFELNNNLILFIFFFFSTSNNLTNTRLRIDSNANQIHTKKVTNHVIQCFKGEIIKTIEKKKKKNWTSTSACRLCCIIIVTHEYSTFVIFWYIILRMLDSDGHLSRLWIYDRWSSQRSHRHRFAIYYADTFNNFLCEP